MNLTEMLLISTCLNNILGNKMTLVMVVTKVTIVFLIIKILIKRKFQI